MERKPVVHDRSGRLYAQLKGDAALPKPSASASHGRKVHRQQVGIDGIGARGRGT